MDYDLGRLIVIYEFGEMNISHMRWGQRERSEFSFEVQHVPNVASEFGEFTFFATKLY